MKRAVRSTLFVSLLALAAGTAVAAPDYCGADGTYTDTATNPDSVLTVDEVKLNGINSDDCYGVVLSNQVDVSALWGGLIDPWTGEAKSDEGDTFDLGGVTFAVTAEQLTEGDWSLLLTGPDGQITVDLIVVLKSADRYAAYFFDDWTFTVPTDEDGTYHISFVNNGGQTPVLSHLSLFARIAEEPGTPPTQIPEPGSLVLLGLGFAGLALVRRRRRS